MSQQPTEVVEGEIMAEDANAGLAVLPDTGLRPIDLGQLTAWAESRQKALAILMEVAIASTKPADWSNQGGNPYPEQGACSAIIGLVGINISPPGEQKEYFEDELGRYYIYFLASEMTVPKFGIGPLPIIGRASSRDQFFAWRTVDGVKQLRPQSEVDPGDIKGKAYTNLRYRAVKAAVPEIAGMTWDRLKELTGGKVAPSSVKQVHYGANGEEALQEGNCPTCHKGNLIEKKRSDGTGTFWVCSLGRWDSQTRKKTGCQHIQNDPPEAPQDAETGTRGDTPPADPNATDMESEASAVPRVAVATVLDMLVVEGSKGKQMTALAKAAKACGLTITGSEPGKWLEGQTDEALGKIVDALDAQETK
ncbi:MAG TPA: hypothetical protein VM537_27075 [Anaerolineae bacterium]|nr:hypothetical protein [Anaerolineae bacterium]